MEETLPTEIISSVHVTNNEQQNIKSLKRNSVDYSNAIPHKICHLNDKMTKQSTNIHRKSSINNDTFYGLPNKAKELFLRIRGISTLYRKYFIY